MTAKTVPKCVKQHSFIIDSETIGELQEIAKRYGSVKNYVYSRFSGISNLNILNSHKKQIRDPWVESRFADQ